MMMQQKGALAAAMAGDEQGGQPAEQQPGQQGGEMDQRMVEAVQLVTGRATQALEASASELDTALKADPVQAAVQFGTRALRSVVMAAAEAGKELPFQVILNAGVALIQVIGTIANDKGYLPDEQIEVFLKEAFQQSVQAYARMDMDDGLIDDKQMQAVGGAMAGKKGA